MGIIIYIVTFVLISDWFQVTFFAQKLLSPSVKKTKLVDKNILELVKEKGGFDLKHIVIIDGEKMYGGMSGIPGKPLMILSRPLIENFTKDELEYVILHETAHFKYHHPIIVVASQFVIVILGLLLLRPENIATAIISGIISSVLFLTIARATERQAENFAAKNMRNPNAMISAVGKFRKNWDQSNFSKLRFIGWNVSYEEKISIAKKHI